jgi:putative peptidoglycan lipid II flippase
VTATSSGTGAPRPPSREAVLNRAGLRSGVGTIASRLTGLLRLVMVAYALGGKGPADAFNLANSTPNIIHDLVLGGVLGATFVPVFVNRIARATAREASESISAVITLAGAGLLVATLLFELLAPEIIRAYTFGTHSGPEQQVAVELLRFFAPQLLFYGAISLMAAVLATQDRFVAVGVVPVVNNIVSIGVLAAFAAIERAPTITSLTNNHSALLLLGLGTTGGVALQALVLAPSLRRSSIRLRFLWRPSDPAVRGILSLSGWTFGFVLTNQVAVFVILAMEYHLGPDRVSAYTYAYAFFQFPFGVAATAIVNVATPDLARAWGEHDTVLMGRRIGMAIRQLLAVILPSMTAYLILAKPAVTLILEHGALNEPDAQRIAAVLVLFSLGLPGYCIYFLAIRTFQAMRDTRTAFWCYLIENGINIGLAVVFYHRLGVQGLALSYSIAYTIAAVVALVIIRHRLGTMGGRAIVASSLRSFAMAIVMAIVVALVVTITGTSTGLLGWGKLIVATAAGGIAYFGGAGLAATLAARRIATSRGRHSLRGR